MFRRLGAVFLAEYYIWSVASASPKIARRYRLLNTMVLTHIPANLLLIIFPLMPTYTFALTALMLRFTIAQMDVPARQKPI